MSSRFLDLGNISSNSLQNAAEAAWDSINVFDRVVLGSYVYQGVWMFMAYKYSGSQYGTALSNLLDEVITSNKKYPDNQITIVFGEITTSDQEEIKNMKKNLDTWTKYEVSTEYDENGYINKIIIEQ